MQLDLDILYFFNQTIAGSFLDSVMIFITNVRHWIPVYIIASGLFIWRYKWRGVRIVIAVALLITITDLFTNQYLKQWIARPRPCSVDAEGSPIVRWLRLADGGRGGFGMPSSHAVNNFAAIAFFLLLFPSKRLAVVLVSIGLLISVTRLYLGLHYPSDVFAGIVIGLLLGYLFGKGFQWLEARYFGKPNFVR